jgi:hypothetical protein
MLLRELLRSFNWTVIDSTPSVQRAVQLVRQGQAFMVITDDTLSVPASRHIRHLLSDPITVCTPVLTFQLEAHRHETTAIQRLGRPEIVEKPLTPSKFIPGFMNLVKTWERDPFLTLRRANYQFLQGNDGNAIHHLNRLSSIDTVRHFCAQAIALHLRRAGKVREAEGVLLAALKQSPRELGTMLALAELYLHAAMPKLAWRLLVGARSVYGQATAILPDVVQTALLLGSLDDAVGALYTLSRAGYSEEETNGFLARVLFAEGREAEAERLLIANKNGFKRIQSAWIAAEQQPLPSAG